MTTTSEPNQSVPETPAESPAASLAEPAPAGNSEAAAEPAPTGPFTLAIDIGGTGIKCLLLDQSGTASGKRRREPTPKPATPQAVLEVIKGLLPDLPYDRVSVGFPGVVIEGVTLSAPNLHKTWTGFNLREAIEKLTGRPARVLNDAGVQGHGVIGGRGVEIVITLGTGMGFSLFVDGHYAPNIELAHHPLRGKKTYEELVGNAARLHAGNKRWRKRVVQAVRQIQATFNPTIIYIGGGNAARLTHDIGLPDNVKLVENLAGLLGGVALWR